MKFHKSLLVLTLVLASGCSKAPTNQAGPVPEDKGGCTTVSGPNFTDFPVCYKNVEGRALYQGDIDLGSILSVQAKNLRQARGAASLSHAYRDYFWTGNTIPYKVNPGIDNAAIVHALTDLGARSGLTFVVRTNQPDYIVFSGTSNPNICGSSPLGMQGGPQTIVLNNTPNSGCLIDGVIQHETMHSLGFWHEQARPDRDSYVRILWENVLDGFESQFDKLPVLADGVGTYDFGSVMHYSRRAFSFNGRDTIQADTEAHNQQIGNRVKASDNDVQAIRAIYATGTKVVMAAQETSATLTFQTASAVATRVRFGVSRSSLDKSAEVAGSRTKHEVQLTGLTPKARYFYSLFMRLDSASQEVWSLTRSFIADAVPPQIIDPRFTASGNVVEFRLSTDENTDSFIAFYTQDDYSDLDFAGDWEFGMIHNHRFVVGQGLYKMVPIVTDEAGNVTEGEIKVLNNDTVAPIISAINLTNRTANGVQINWTTNEASSSLVDYGTSSSSLQRVTGPANVTNHSVSLSGLAANNTYYFRVSSADANGNIRSSSLFTFSTDLVAPVISAISVTNRTVSDAQINWTTNEPASTLVDYGTTQSVPTRLTGTANVTAHSLVLSGLSNNTAYFFRVNSADAAGNLTSSAVLSFTTDVTAPVISSISVTNRTVSGAQINWTTNEASSTIIDYGTDQNVATRVTGAANATAHSMALSGLSNNTTYYYRVTSVDGSGNSSSSAIASFTTDVTAPTLTGLALTELTANSVNVNWTTSEAATSLVYYGLSCSNLSMAASVSGLVISHQVPLTGLLANTTYCYQTASRDASNNEVLSARLSFTTSNPVAPMISNVASSVAASSVAISWLTNLASRSEVLYGTASGSYPYLASDAANVTSHSVTLTQNLVAGQTYYYKVRSTTPQGGVTTSGEFSFRFLDTVGIRVVNDSFYYQLARYVYGTSTRDQSGATLMTMKIVSNYTGGVLYSASMTYNSSTHEYLAEIPFSLSANDVYYGWASVRVESSLGGSKTWPY